MEFNYKISSTGGNSNKYGVCEICKSHATEIFLQSKSKFFIRPDGSEGNAHKSSTFGHEQFLINIRK